MIQLRTADKQMIIMDMYRNVFVMHNVAFRLYTKVHQMHLCSWSSHNCGLYVICLFVNVHHFTCDRDPFCNEATNLLIHIKSTIHRWKPCSISLCHKLVNNTIAMWSHKMEVRHILIS